VCKQEDYTFELFHRCLGSHAFVTVLQACCWALLQLWCKCASTLLAGHQESMDAPVQHCIHAMRLATYLAPCSACDGRPLSSVWLGATAPIMNG
jgi:hypothetical protein